MDDQESSERTWKVREKSENSKIIGYGRQSSEELFILFKRRKDVHSHEKGGGRVVQWCWVNFQYQGVLLIFGLQ